jgi:hypothetical protein
LRRSQSIFATEWPKFRSSESWLRLRKHLALAAVKVQRTGVSPLRRQVMSCESNRRLNAEIKFLNVPNGVSTKADSDGDIFQKLQVHRTFARGFDVRVISMVTDRAARSGHAAINRTLAFDASLIAPMKNPPGREPGGLSDRGYVYSAASLTTAFLEASHDKWACAS